MFSSNGTQKGGSTTGMTTRGRRRQRPLSNDTGVPQPKAKRARIPLSEQTYVNPDVPSRNPSETYEVKAAKPSVERKQDGFEEPSPQVSSKHQDLSVRSKKARPGDRLNKGDGSTLLTTNTVFDARKLPALPERLRLDIAGRQHGSVDSFSGYALSVTHTHAIVWSYAASTQFPESFIFNLSHSSRDSDPLPLGALVPPSISSAEPGLVVVIPTTGKVTYWESIASATALDFMRQQRNGVEETITGMFSGETVIQIANAESATGFVMAFSSGRVAYLGVRDAHGRPRISTHFLQSSLGPASSGFFGSIRHALSSAATQGDIVAIRADKSPNLGESSAVAATSKGRLHAWRVHRGGHHDVVADVDARSVIMTEIRARDQPSTRMLPESFKIVDFCIVPKCQDARLAEMSQLRPSSILEENQQHLLLLTSFSDAESSRYSLVEVTLSPTDSAQPVQIGMVRPISAYTTRPDTQAITKPRLHLPLPNLMAFVLFERAVVVTSIAQPPDSPDSQFMEDTGVLPVAYEDVIDLRPDAGLEIVGSGIEEPYVHGSSIDDMRAPRVRTKNPAVVLFVRGVGIIRVTVSDVERFASERAPKITAKMKLEQAVFFGIKEDNPLIFDVAREQLGSDEYGNAALTLSQEILTSSGPHLSSVAARVETNIRERVRLLEKMMSHMRKLNIALDRVTKWRLLWDAEKMNVASALWRKHEEFTTARPTNAKKSLIAEIVEFMRSEEKSEPDTARGEIDLLRHWFAHDVDRMELFIAWAYQVIKHNSKASAETSVLSRFIYEAVEVYNGSIRDALTFRRKNLELYGLANEKVENGILSTGYGELPVPWTCNHLITNNVKRQLELASQWVKQQWEASKQAGAEIQDFDLIQKTQQLLPRLTEIYLTTLQELSRAYLASSDSKTVADGQRYLAIYEQDVHEKIVLLAESENWDSAIEIAENHKSLQALAEVLTKEINMIRDQLDACPNSSEASKRLDAKMTDKEEQAKSYFAVYGKDFAFPFYEYLLRTFGIDALLDYSGDKVFKTMFLRTKPELAKISWINDIIGEEDIEHAADTLLNLGLAREQQLWNKKIELSLGKLAHMAEASSRPSSKASFNPKETEANMTAEDVRVRAIDQELAIISIQNQFYNTQIRPIIANALDDQSQVDLILEGFALKHPKKYKILSQIFEDGLRRLLKHEALDALTLIDILTLITLTPETRDHIADQFFLAIQVAYNGLKGDERTQAERLIWRRCFLREEWTKINNTSLKNDGEIMDLLSQTGLFQTYCVLYADERDGDKVQYRRITPSEAEGVYTEKLDRRFEKMEKSHREKVIEAMRWEDSNLHKHIEKHRLEMWASDTQKYAEEAVRQQYDETTQAGAAAAVKNGGR